jgi:hypothetical protein
MTNINLNTFSISHLDQHRIQFNSWYRKRVFLNYQNKLGRNFKNHMYYSLDYKGNIIQSFYQSIAIMYIIHRKVVSRFLQNK